MFYLFCDKFQGITFLVSKIEHFENENHQDIKNTLTLSHGYERIQLIFIFLRSKQYHWAFRLPVRLSSMNPIFSHRQFWVRALCSYYLLFHFFSELSCRDFQSFFSFLARELDVWVKDYKEISSQNAVMLADFSQVCDKARLTLINMGRGMMAKMFLTTVLKRLGGGS